MIERHEIYTSGVLTRVERLAGLAYLAYAGARLCGDAVWVRRYEGDDYDPVLHAPCKYDPETGGWVRAAEFDNYPPCPNPREPCRWYKPASDVSLPLQRNALRIEAGREPTHRCGWRLKDGHLGGNFFDYLPCVRRFQGRYQ
jgi:hypothetical protein